MDSILVRKGFVLGTIMVLVSMSVTPLATSTEKEVNDQIDIVNNDEDFSNRQIEKFTSGEIIVKFKPDSNISFSKTADGFIQTDLPSIDILNEKYRVSSIRKLFTCYKKTVKRDPYLFNIFKIKIPQDSDILDMVAEYSSDPNVEYAEPNYIFEYCTIPNDPSFYLQWALHNIGQTDGTFDADIDAPEAWDVETGDPTVIIGMTDSGVDWTHSDLMGNIWVNPGEDIDGDNVVGDFGPPSSGGDEDGIDNDGNGKIDDLIGWDFPSDDNDPIDLTFGHGTHCSGIASAVGNNEVGITGICWDCTIMPIRIGGSMGINIEDAANGTIYAADNGAHVISMSWGGSSESQLLLDAVNYAYSQGAVLVAAAGNGNIDKEKYPASYENVIAVAATDHKDRRTRFSNYGEWVDIAAPGLFILSTMPGDTYEEKSGTSMACPYVSGLTALILSKYGGIDQDTVKTILLSTVDDVLNLTLSD